MNFLSRLVFGDLPKELREFVLLNAAFLVFAGAAILCVSKDAQSATGSEGWVFALGFLVLLILVILWARHFGFSQLRWVGVSVITLSISSFLFLIRDFGLPPASVVILAGAMFLYLVRLIAGIPDSHEWRTYFRKALWKKRLQ